MPNLGIKRPAYSETLIPIPTTEKGHRLIEAQELQEKLDTRRDARGFGTTGQN
jgi:hypothetical protein